MAGRMFNPGGGELPQAVIPFGHATEFPPVLEEGAAFCPMMAAARFEFVGKMYSAPWPAGEIVGPAALESRDRSLDYFRDLGRCRADSCAFSPCASARAVRRRPWWTRLALAVIGR